MVTGLAALALTALTSQAFATDFAATPTLWSIDPPGTGYRYTYDRAMSCFEPSSGVQAKGELIVIFGGRPGPTPTAYGPFQQYAAGLGFHSCAIDYDYEHEEGSDPPLDPGQICGCYDDCYSWLNLMVSDGTNHPGIPTSQYPVKARLRSVLHYLAFSRPGQGWSDFLTTSEDMVWSKYVLVGLSRGAELAARIAKYNGVARLLTFSGPNDSLSDTAGSTWSDPTSYQYGNANGLGSCVPQLNYTAVHILTDNDFTQNGHHWSTSNANMYTWVAEANTKSWNRTLPAIVTLGINTFGTGRAYVGNSTYESNGWQGTNAHFLSADGSATTGYVCGTAGDQPSIHVAMLSGACSGGNATLREHVWNYMLLH